MAAPDAAAPLGYECDVAVVGAGVVGLAVARALALAGREVVVLEAANAIGTGTSSRNSEVIHSGIYYPPGSLRAASCVPGRAQLYAYCAARGVAHARCGKLVVATDAAELAYLEKLRDNGRANGVDDLTLLDAAAVAALEPEVTAVGALLSPSTGIVDSHALMLALRGDLEAAGGTIAFETPVLAGAVEPDIRLRTGGAAPAELCCRVLVNAAGHGAPPLLRALEGFPQQRAPQAWFAKGNYFALAARSPFRHLVYPVPEPGGLGVHATLDLMGRVRFGPDVEWVDDPNDLSVDPARATRFYAAIRRYWPGLPDESLQPDYAGLRPKLTGPGAPAADFVIQDAADHGVAGLVNLLGIESPGLTVCLALADMVAERVARFAPA